MQSNCDMQVKVRRSVDGRADIVYRRCMSSADVAARFTAMHASGCFVLPNPWDVGSALFLQQLGFRALATTSGGFAFSRGLPDGEWAVGRDAVLAHVRDIAGATSLPVNADFESGYAHDPEGVAANVALCVEAGAAGLSIEDATGDKNAPLYPLDRAVARIAAARSAIDQSGIPVVLTARCEVYLVGRPDAARIARERLVAYATAGADCLFAPGIRDAGEIGELVRAVAPRPVNVLVSAPSAGISVARLAELGVRRVSVGSALARAAWGGFARAARELATAGTFGGLADALPFAELNALFHGRR